VQNVGARLEAEHGIVQLDCRPCRRGVEGFDLNLHDLALLAFGLRQPRTSFSGSVGSGRSGIVAVGSLLEAGGIGRFGRARDLDRVLDGSQLFFEPGPNP
jgi:hypothetical protein